MLQDVLASLPAEREFLIHVAAYTNSHNPGFVPPVVCNKTLDLYSVRTSFSLQGLRLGLTLASIMTCPWFHCRLCLASLPAETGLHGRQCPGRLPGCLHILAVGRCV